MTLIYRGIAVHRLFTDIIFELLAKALTDLKQKRLRNPKALC